MIFSLNENETFENTKVPNIPLRPHQMATLRKFEV